MAIADPRPMPDWVTELIWGMSAKIIRADDEGYSETISILSATRKKRFGASG